MVRVPTRPTSRTRVSSEARSSNEATSRAISLPRFAVWCAASVVAGGLLIPDAHVLSPPPRGADSLPRSRRRAKPFVAPPWPSSHTHQHQLLPPLTPCPFFSGSILRKPRRNHDVDTLDLGAVPDWTVPHQPVGDPAHAADCEWTCCGGVFAAARPRAALSSAEGCGRPERGCRGGSAAQESSAALPAPAAARLAPAAAASPCHSAHFQSPSPHISPPSPPSCLPSSFSACWPTTARWMATRCTTARTRRCTSPSASACRRSSLRCSCSACSLPTRSRAPSSASRYGMRHGCKGRSIGNCNFCVAARSPRPACKSPQQYLAYSDLALSSLWTLLWFIAFCWTADAVRCARPYSLSPLTCHNPPPPDF